MKIIIYGIALALILLLAGCTQGGTIEQKKNGSVVILNENKTGLNTTPAAQIMPPNGAKARLIDLLKRQQNSTWMVNRTYFLNSNQSIYFKNRSNYRADVGVQTAYVLNGTTYYCAEVEKKFTCHMAQTDDLTLRSLVRNSIFFLNREDIEGLEENDVSAMPDIPIVGIQASCFNVPKGEMAGILQDPKLMKAYLTMLNGSQIEYCFAPDGAPLLRQSIINQTTLVGSETTQYSTGVSAEDLALPGPIVK